MSLRTPSPSPACSGPFRCLFWPSCCPTAASLHLPHHLGPSCSPPLPLLCHCTSSNHPWTPFPPSPLLPGPLRDCFNLPPPWVSSLPPQLSRQPQQFALIHAMPAPCTPSPLPVSWPLGCSSDLFPPLCALSGPFRPSHLSYITHMCCLTPSDPPWMSVTPPCSHYLWPLSSPSPSFTPSHHLWCLRLSSLPSSPSPSELLRPQLRRHLSLFLSSFSLWPSQVSHMNLLFICGYS
jgi:hypothetical protein